MLKNIDSRFLDLISLSKSRAESFRLPNSSLISDGIKAPK